MFSIMTEENGEHLKELPHLCPNGAKIMGNKSKKSGVCAQPPDFAGSSVILPESSVILPGKQRNFAGKAA